MKLFYRIFTALMLFVIAAHAQIQKITYTTAGKQLLKLSRISPAASKQPDKSRWMAPGNFLPISIHHRPIKIFRSPENG